MARELIEDTQSSGASASHAADARTSRAVGPQREGRDPSSGRESIHFIHFLRGIAPILVLWAHLSGFWLWANQRGWVPQDLWARFVVVPFHLYQNAGHLGVVIFFLISGYIITHASLRETRAAFAIKRFARIVPALAVTLFVTYVIIVASSRLGLGPMPGIQPGAFWDYVRAGLLIDVLSGSGFILGQTWTLAIEIVFYGAVLILMRRTHRSPYSSTWLMLAAYAVVSSVSIAVGSLSHVRGTFIYVAFLILGRILYFWQRSSIDLARAVTLFFATAFLFVCFDTAAFPGELMTPGVEPAVTYVLAIVAFVAMMLASIRRVVQPFKFLGDISYSLYLLHLPIGMFVINISVQHGLPFTIAFLLASSASIAAAYASHRMIEVPSQKAARWLVARTARLDRQM